jgi:hypothetical protein
MTHNDMLPINILCYVIITMSSIKDKIKEKVTDAKDKVVGTTENVSDTVRGKAHEEGVAGTGANRYKDPTREYDEKEPMSPAKIREHEPTAVKREMTERIVEPGQQDTSDPEKAREIARRSGMAKGTAGADETESEYEQGESGTSK